MSIISKVQIEGFCKKVKNKDLYAYPETPCSAYRLISAGALSWTDYPELKKMWDKQLEAIKIARGIL